MPTWFDLWPVFGLLPALFALFARFYCLPIVSLCLPADFNPFTQCPSCAFESSASASASYLTHDIHDLPLCAMPFCQLQLTSVGKDHPWVIICFLIDGKSHGKTKTNNILFATSLPCVWHSLVPSEDVNL